VVSRGCGAEAGWIFHHDHLVRWLMRGVNGGEALRQCRRAVRRRDDDREPFHAPIL